MKNEDKPRFSIAMVWLAKKYPLGRDPQGDPIPRKLDAEYLRDYFDALSDLNIDGIERGVKWHYAHNEFFPERPGALRKSVESAPRPADPPWRPPQTEGTLLPELPRDEAKKRLQACFDWMNETFGTKLKA